MERNNNNNFNCNEYNNKNNKNNNNNNNKEEGAGKVPFLFFPEFILDKAPLAFQFTAEFDHLPSPLFIFFFLLIFYLNYSYFYLIIDLNSSSLFNIININIIQ